MGLELVIGIGIMAALMLYLALNLDEKHHIALKILLIFIFAVLVFQLPKATLDAKETCDILKANETVIENFTSFEYKEVCFTDSKSTARVFYLTGIWFVNLFYLYFFIYAGWVMWQKYKKKKLPI